MTPTQRSIQHMEKAGWLADVVERYNAFTRRRSDLFGMFDIVCCRPGEIAFVQTTTASNVSSRIRKISEHENIGRVRESGARLLVHGWRKRGGRWVVREEDIS